MHSSSEYREDMQNPMEEAAEPSELHPVPRALGVTLVFLLVFALVSVCTMELYFSGEDHYYQDCDERDSLAGTIDTLIIGASHAERGFDPSVIDEELGCNSYNLAGPDFTMWGRYDLLKKEIARNPVKSVVLEVSDYTLTKRTSSGTEVEGDLYYMGRIGSFPQRVIYFAENFSPEDYISSYQFFMVYGIDSIKRILQGKYMSTYDWPYRYKGYKMYETADGGSKDMTTDYAKKYKKRHIEFEIMDQKVEYLQKIVDLCQENDVELTLVCVPVSKAMLCKTDDNDFWYTWYSEFAEENGIAYYDFNLLRNRDELFSDETSFHDQEHLSNEGADVFSEAYAEIVRLAAAGEDTSGLFFESYDAYERTQDYYPE